MKVGRGVASLSGIPFSGRASSVLSQGRFENIHFLLCCGYGLRSSARSQLSLEKSMKTILTASLLLLSSFAAVGQTQPVSTASDDNATRTDDRAHNNYGWIGLIGLAGLVGLRRQKSVEHSRMAASGVNVKTVGV
jgi:MYXO-CTERM domain-containing protein